MLDNVYKYPVVLLEPTNKAINVADEAEIVHREDLISVLRPICEDVVVDLRDDIFLSLAPVTEFDLQYEVDTEKVPWARND